ncbi:uncharacterized protein LOC142172522 [Nicotiana tabacum]|uniref:Uncharacterized protein LOC142172522 n=1 Tax=Nicotiana tabacum TaxID=4097 RepID=A0AC58T510_TOBAC
MADSGATHHITSSLDLLNESNHTIKTSTDRVHLPTGGQADITHVGSAKLFNGETISNVLYVPNFKFNLLGRVQGIGRENEGLYVLRSDSDDDELIKRIKAVHAAENARRDSLWYMRLGHPSLATMKNIVELYDSINNRVQNKFHICPLAKQTRLQFPLSSSRAEAPFHLLKSEVIVVLKQYVAMIKTQFNTMIRIVRSDNGTQFFNSQCTELFTKLGIIHQSSCPYTPQQNGVVERKHRHILDTARALKFQASIPLRYWGMCVKAAVYLINRTQVSSGCTTPPDTIFMDAILLHPLQDTTAASDIDGPSEVREEEATYVQDSIVPDSEDNETPEVETSIPEDDTENNEDISAADNTPSAPTNVPTETENFREAVKDPKWIEAMKQEITAFEENKTSIIALAASKNWELFQMVVYNTFLQGDLCEEVYMEMSEGFTQRNHDYSLFTMKKGEDVVIILVYVDDLLITGSSKELVNIAKKMELSGTKPYATPLEANQKLTTMEYDKAVSAIDDLPLQDVCAYQRLLGKLLYVTITRPDISYTV